MCQFVGHKQFVGSKVRAARAAPQCFNIGVKCGTALQAPTSTPKMYTVQDDLIIRLAKPQKSHHILQRLSSYFEVSLACCDLVLAVDTIQEILSSSLHHDWPFRSIRIKP